MEKADKTVTHVQKSINASDLLGSENKLQAKVATWRNSELLHIKLILHILKDKLLQLDIICLNTYEQNMLQNLVEILTPFQEATDVTQGDKIFFVCKCTWSKFQACNSNRLSYCATVIQPQVG